MWPGPEHNFHGESKSRLVDGGPGLSASNRKPQLYLSDSTDVDTEQSIRCAL